MDVAIEKLLFVVNQTFGMLLFPNGTTLFMELIATEHDSWSYYMATHYIGLIGHKAIFKDFH